MTQGQGYSIISNRNTLRVWDMSSSIILGLSVKINKDLIDRKNGKLDEKHQENRDSIYKSMVNVLTDAYNYENIKNYEILRDLILSSSKIDEDLLGFLRGKCFEELSKLQQVQRAYSAKENKSPEDIKNMMKVIEYKSVCNTILGFILDRLINYVLENTNIDDIDKKMKELGINNQEKPLLYEKCGQRMKKDTIENIKKLQRIKECLNGYNNEQSQGNV